VLSTTVRLLVGLLAALLVTAIFGWFLFDVVPVGTLHFDSAAREAIHSVASPGVTPLMIIASLVGRPIVICVIALLLAALFLRCGREDAAKAILITMAGAFVLEGLLKIFFQRKRPDAYFGYALPRSFSFPSGHAIFAVCFFGVLAAVVSPLLSSRSARVCLWCAAMAGAGIIGISRIYLGVHYPTDVMAGYLTAGVWVFAVVHRNRYRRVRVKPQ
jgi:undecaprenyl-diphosphatase